VADPDAISEEQKPEATTDLGPNQLDPYGRWLYQQRRDDPWALVQTATTETNSANSTFVEHASAVQKVPSTVCALKSEVLEE
jgi:hypothetical protein